MNPVLNKLRGLTGNSLETLVMGHLCLHVIAACLLCAHVSRERENRDVGTVKVSDQWLCYVLTLCTQIPLHR